MIHDDDALALVMPGNDNTLLKSIFASDRVSRIRLTIHFSPSSGDKFNRLERSLRVSHARGKVVPNVDNLMNATIRL